MSKKKVLIIGIAGGLAQMTAKLMLEERKDLEIIGVDARDVSECEEIEGLTIKRMKYSRGNFESLFRDQEFEIVFHLARISHSSTHQNNLAKRLDLSLMGTSRILDLCQRFHTKKVVILSTFHVYGALADNSVYIKENATLRASIMYPQLRDVVEMDQICTSWMWKNQNHTSTIVLRPCNIIGNRIQNAMTLFLTSPAILNPLDFNPMFQFIHEFDMARVLKSCLEEVPTGIYNVAPKEFVSLDEAIKHLGAKSIPFPVSLGKSLNKALSMVNLDIPDYLIDYLKFSCIIDGSSLLEHLGPDFYRFSVEDSLKLLRLS